MKSKILPCVLAVCLTACALQKSVDDCEAISNDDDRLACLNHSMYGNLLQGAGIGALGGAFFGAVIGGAVGGPRAMVIGAASGAAVGGLAGGAFAYFRYNQERSAGDARRMAENAQADLQAQNRDLATLVDEYKLRLHDAEAKVKSLHESLTRGRFDASQLDAALTKARSEIAVLSKSIELQNKIKQNADQYAAMTGSESELREELMTMQGKISELEGIKADRERTITALTDDLKDMRGQLMAPGIPTKPSESPSM